MKVTCHLLAGAALAAALAARAPAMMPDRHGAHAKRAARGKLMQVTSATFFGGPGAEEFVAAGCLPDGTIVAFGNAWGPTMPEPLQPTVIGKGEWYEVNEFPDGCPTTEEGRPLDPAPDYPNIAGLIVQYAPDMQSYRRILRFDWGLATITCGAVAADGDLILAGRGTEHLRPFAEGAGLLNTVPPGDSPPLFGPIYYHGVKMPGDVYVAKLAPDGRQVKWVWLFEGHRQAPRKIWTDKKGGVTFEMFRDLHRLSLDGRDHRQYGEGGHWKGRLLAVSPFDGGYVRGGDRQFGTGREPWRKPECYGFDADANLKWKIWDWTGPLVGHDRFRLVSDSSVRQASYDPETGDLLVAGWSDGGNTVFTRQAADLSEPAPPETGYGMSLWGAGAGSFMHLMRVDLERLYTRAYSVWSAYLPRTFGENQGMPNGLKVDGIQAGPGGAVALRGGAATGLIQTPNAFYEYPYDWPAPYRYGGDYVTIFNREFNNLYFSSYMPGCSVAEVGLTRRGFAFVGRSTGSDAARGDPKVTPSPIAAALQKEHGGGRWDAHLTVIEYP